MLYILYTTSLFNKILFTQQDVNHDPFQLELDLMTPRS